MSRENIDALLFDFGGVIVEISFDRVFQRWAELARVPMERVKERFTHGETYQRHERGEIDIATYFESLRTDLGIDLTDEAFAEGWAQVFGPEYGPTVALLHRLEGRMPLYLFSNTNAAHYQLWSARYAEALRPFKRRFISSEMGVRKPTPESFERVAREIGVAPERILFFDDTEANLEGAGAVGMPNVRVRSPQDVAHALRHWL